MERLRREQTAAEGRAVEEKKRAMTDLADRFQASVGSIVQTVSSSAAEMQTTAGSLTTNAKGTGRQAAAVAAALEPAPAKVQKGAGADEDTARPPATHAPTG